MGLFSKMFGSGKSNGVVQGRNPGGAWTEANKFNRARGGFTGGYGAWTFGNIMNAHCSPEDIVEEFCLNKDDNHYGCDAYLTAYQEEYDIAWAEYEDLMAFYMELIDLNESLIEEKESEIAECELQIEELEEELEDLQDELETEDNPMDMIEIMDEMEQIMTEIRELQERIEVLNEEIAFLQLEIQGWYSEMEMISVEDMINYDEVDKKAMDYACEFAQQWIDGNVWIPSEVLHWAYYTISDHNG